MRMSSLLFGILLLTTAMVNGQVLHYDVVKGSKSLGEMKIERVMDGPTTEIFIKSEVTYRVLFAFTIRYSMHEKFRHGTLEWGKSLSTLNGSTQKDSKIALKDGKYIHTLNGVSSSISSMPDYSVSEIYFDEPFDGKQVYSQTFGQYLTFKKIGTGKYMLTSPDGDNFYTYLNGICTEVKVVRDFATFYFMMKPDDLLMVQAKADSLKAGGQNNP
jgi:hypothetical protein